MTFLSKSFCLCILLLKSIPCYLKKKKAVFHVLLFTAVILWPSVLRVSELSVLCPHLPCIAPPHLISACSAKCEACLAGV